MSKDNEPEMARLRAGIRICICISLYLQNILCVTCTEILGEVSVVKVELRSNFRAAVGSEIESKMTRWSSTSTPHHHVNNKDDEMV